MADLRRNFKGAYTVWYRDVIRFRRDRMRMVSSLVMPAVYLFVFGSGLAPAMAEMGGGHIDFKQFMFPGVLTMTVLFTSVFSAVSIVWDREFGFLKEVMVAPVSRVAVALGKAAGGSTVALFQGVIVLVLAPVLGIKLTVSQLVTLAGLMVLLALMMTSLGILMAVRQRSMEGFHMLMNFVLMPMFFLSGAFFPLRGVPIWMELLSRVDPVTYGVDPLRQVALRAVVPAQFMDAIALRPMMVNVMMMVTFAIVFLVPAVWLFGRQD
ncbi:MAG: ABC transporter permease [Anaerolineales bacterium]|jgi:ABC-2 type transport system permease protein|nr:ABC transporter [Anaerolineaceae bacterium]MDP7346179.1 ABC transporter permease [Anaerolineales bacterium]MDP7645095.1 ABC transporter permease [Anaerolineales bacterium]HJN40551.1 ABC transporter permease [Anaerolineales bacterium]|tara:strand:+ start:1371 stop:2168 length:798 start_codon:yes stop_codon:yes gene_type:complete